ncbi:MAG TPA: DNA repair protein RadA [Patescibacteria group bacterium]|nr:DNA repair protein RadA [Patescibacteria group bacterium]
MSLFICASCGYGSASWYGKCPSCGEWNMMREQKEIGVGEETKKATIISLSKVTSRTRERKKTRFFEFDRVLGGGFAQGSVVLLSGDPGIGKSTLLLTSFSGMKTLYVSGEESGEQVKERAERTGVDLAHIYFSDDVQIEGILEAAGEKKNIYDIIVIDSIQTVYSKKIEASPGAPAQIKEIAAQVIDFAKKNNISVIMIGHVTKEGGIAGPKLLEHVVDVVLYFEGDRQSQFRILRAHKNRFGSTDEVGIFEMKEKGFVEASGSTMFLDEETKRAPGKVLVGVAEGNRPLFFEVQTLVVESFLTIPRRVSSGIDYNKLLLLLAVVRKNMGLPLDRYDIYVNVVGGISIKSTAADLGVIASVISSFKNIPAPEKSVFVGEVGLLGEVRKVIRQAKIMRDAERFGFSHIFSYKNISFVKELEAILTSRH